MARRMKRTAADGSNSYSLAKTKIRQDPTVQRYAAKNLKLLAVKKDRQPVTKHARCTWISLKEVGDTSVHSIPMWKISRTFYVNYSKKNLPTVAVN